MNLSKGILDAITRLQNTGSFHLNAVQKRELSNFNKQNNLKELDNFDCATCVRDCLYAAGRFLKTYRDAPKLQRLDMQKKPKDMKFTELKKFCKDKGIEFKRSDKKTDLIQKANDYLGTI